MLRWMWGKMRDRDIAAIRKAIFNVSESLRGMSREERAIFFYSAQLVRVGICKADFKATSAFEGIPGPIMTEVASALYGICGQFARVNSPHTAGASMMMISLQAMCFPEVRYLAQALWSNLNSVTREEFDNVSYTFYRLDPGSIRISFEEFSYIPWVLRARATV